MNSLIQLPLPLEGVTIKIPLGRGYFATIDAIDADLVAYKWSPQISKSGTVYAKRTTALTGGESKTYLHRIIQGRKEQRTLQQKELVDHEDGDGLNNTRHNLRLATHANNCQNSKRSKLNSSGFKGVSQTGNKWRAQINPSGKRIHLGTFNTPELAHLAYCKAATQHYGSFARFS